MSVAEILEAIKAIYIEKITSEMENSLTPARENDIIEFERMIGCSLPADYREFLLLNDIRHNFSGNFECLDLEGVISDWEMMGGLLDDGTFDGRVEQWKTDGADNWDSGRIKDHWWSKLWIPVSADSCGNTKCIDLDPGPNGIKGQLISMEVQEGQGPFSSNCTSFREYILRHLTALQEGHYNIYEHGLEIDPRLF